MSSSSYKNGKDDCHWEDAETFLVNGVLKCCGCVDSKSVLKVVIAVLSRMSEYEELECEAFVNQFFGGAEGAAYLVITMLEEIGALEHGTSCRYSWPTSDGQLLLQSCKLVLSELEEHNYIRIPVTI